VQKTREDILAEIEEAERAAFGPSINTLATSVFGQINGIFAEQLAEQWELAAAIYRAMYPDSASDESLDNVAAITGALRLAATQSTVPIVCTGTPSTVLSAGRVVSTGGGDRFASDADATIVAATAWVGSTAYAVDDFVANDSNIYVCTVAGTSAASGGPTGTADGITDGSCEWNFVGDGIGFVEHGFTAEQFGPISASAGAIDTEDSVGAIETPVSGWDDARNITDAELGRNLETDAAFRLRREQLLRLAGSATLEAIRSAVLDVDDVIAVFVFENTTLITDGAGVPGKAFETTVQGGTDLDVAQAIFDTKPVGIETHRDPGANGRTIAITDSQGFSHDIKFSRPTTIQMHIEIDLTIDAGTFGGGVQATGIQQVKDTLAAFGDALGIGSDVIILAFACAALEVPGVIDVTDIRIEDTDPPTNAANISILPRELATFDTADIDVVIP
jgi:uncharacterized phage protein gp47/JayE